MPEVVPIGARKDCQIEFLNIHRSGLDLSGIYLDAGHPPIRGADTAEYHGREKLPTFNALNLTDRLGLSFATSERLVEKHSDLNNGMEEQFEGVTATPQQGDIPVEGLFINANAGFDSKDFRTPRLQNDINQTNVSIT